MKITTIENATAASTESYTYYKWKFSISESKVTALPELLNSTKGSLTKSNTDATDGIQFIPSGAFATYSVESSNCVSAVAAWLNWMGVTDLKDIVDASSYMRYNPCLMRQMLSDNWVQVDFKEGD